MVNRKTFSKKQRDKIWDGAGGEGKQRITDEFGTEIDRAAYGDRNSKFGWNLDHNKSIAKGGSNKLDNMRPMHIKNNEDRGSG